MSGISIVIPCRDGAAWLGQTIRSALAQTLAPDEIIVIDDGSQDDSRAIAAAFGPPVRVEAGPATGAAHARNRGAALARGERLMFLDADDLLTPPTLAALARALDQHGKPAIALCPWDRYEDKGFGWVAAPPTAPPPRPAQDRLAAWLTGSWSPPCAILWDRSCFEASGGWWQDAGLDDDGNLLRRALARQIATVDAPGGLALYRRVPGEAKSYSSRRLEPFGLRSRLRSLTDTIAELESKGTLARYRAPLAEALTALHRDAATEAEIAAEVRQLLARLGGTRLLDPGRAAVGPHAGRMKAWLSERRTRPAPQEQARRSATASHGHPGKVSVIIPTYNRAELVQRAARSVLSQSWADLEVIVVDDGSTDDTRLRLAEIGDERLRVVHQPNAGVAAARNRGLREVAGDFVTFLDSDDTWRADKLARQVEALVRAPSHVGVCCTGGEIITPGRPAQRAHSPEGRLFEQLLLRNTLFLGISALFRREAVEAVGGFDPALPAIEDWDFLQRVARLYDFVNIDEPLAIYDAEVRPDRRSLHFRANMTAREMLWRRNRHALRRAGLSHAYLLDSARRELREPEGSSARGRALVLRALWERPQERSLWLWVPYSLTPYRARAFLRRLDGRRRIQAPSG